MKRPVPFVPISPGGSECCAGNDFVLVGTAPAVGPLPELQTFRCRICGHVETIETPRPEAGAPDILN